MIALLAVAYGHSVGGHPALHAIDWHIARTQTRVHYEVEVPAAFLRRPDAATAMTTELSGALKLTANGVSVPLTLADTNIQRTEHGGLFALDLTAPVPAGITALQLENGNLPDTTSLHRTTLTVGPPVDVLDCSLLVAHDGAIVRSDSGRTVALPAARTTTVTVSTPANALQALHRDLQDRTVRGPLDARPANAWTHNRTPLGVAFAIPLLALLGLPAPRRPENAVWAGLLAIAALDLTTASAFGPALALVGFAACILALRRPSALWLAAPALAASLDLRGVSIPVIALQVAIAGRAPESRLRLAVAVGAMVGAVLGARALVSAL